jgi:predicted nucleic acid-binding protein
VRRGIRSQNLWLSPCARGKWRETDLIVASATALVWGFTLVHENASDFEAAAWDGRACVDLVLALRPE